MKMMKFAIPALLAFSTAFAQQGAPTGAAVDPTADEQKALDALKGKLEGAIVWASSRANSHHDIWIMNADGSNMSVHDALQAIWTEVSQYLANESLDDNMKEENPNG